MESWRGSDRFGRALFGMYLVFTAWYIYEYHAEGDPLDAVIAATDYILGHMFLYSGFVRRKNREFHETFKKEMGL